MPVFSTAFGPPIHSLFLFYSFLFTYRIPAHLDAMGVVHQAVEDSVGQCGISDLFVPARHRQLRSQDHRVRLVAILSDLPEVSSLRFRHRGHDPIIDNQNIDPIQPPQQLPQTAIGACQAQAAPRKRAARTRLVRAWFWRQFHC